MLMFYLVTKSLTRRKCIFYFTKYILFKKKKEEEAGK